MIKATTVGTFYRTEKGKLLDQFAMAALTGILAASTVDHDLKIDEHLVASAAYTFADAMMQERGEYE